MYLFALTCVCVHRLTPTQPQTYTNACRKPNSTNSTSDRIRTHTMPTWRQQHQQHQQQQQQSQQQTGCASAPTARHGEQACHWQRRSSSQGDSSTSVGYHTMGLQRAMGDAEQRAERQGRGGEREVKGGSQGVTAQDWGL